VFTVNKRPNQELLSCGDVYRLIYEDTYEIEGREEDIRSFAFRLGLQWGKRIILNYLEIFDILKKKMNLDFRDVTFDNFKNLRLDPTAYLSLMEADGFD